jgi:small subunit ribosomal protein S10
MSEENNNQIKITIYGYNVAAVEEATSLVSKKLPQLKLAFSYPIALPTKIKIASALISPHKHKKAQEKFEQVTHKRVIFVDNISPFNLETLEEELKIPNTAHLELKSVKNPIKLRSRL